MLSHAASRGPPRGLLLEDKLAPPTDWWEPSLTTHRGPGVPKFQQISFLQPHLYVSQVSLNTWVDREGLKSQGNPDSLS